ncbi:hypothetical protein KKA14_19500, partial [bacterium]|nr:hypothetical protein [bacterium]
YLIRNSSAVIGIKGTVFYTQVLSEEDKEEGRIPQEASDYFCLCDGDIDFLTKEFDTLKSEKATYHNGFFLLSNQGEINFKKADFLLNHSDSEIIDLIKNMKGEKHRIDWIQSNRGKSRHYS